MVVDCVWNVMAQAQKPGFVFRRKGRVHLNRRGRQFSRLLAAEVLASAVVMLDTPCSEVVWGVLATHSIRQFSLHFPSRASPCAITFQPDSTTKNHVPEYNNNNVVYIKYLFTSAGSLGASVHPMLTVTQTSYSCHEVLEKKSTDSSPSHSQVSRNSSRKSNNSLLVTNGKLEGKWVGQRHPRVHFLFYA